MSVSSSAPKTAQVLQEVQLRPLDRQFAAFGLLWIITSWWLATDVLLPFLFQGLIAAGVPLIELVRHNLVVFGLVNFSYAPLVVGLSWLGLRLSLRRRGLTLRYLVGLLRWPVSRDALAVPLAYVVYFALSLIIADLIAWLLPTVNLQQTQELGFAAPDSLFSYVITFVMLVLVPPVVEELIFRGFILGSLLRGFRFVISAVVTSLLFGLVHLGPGMHINLFMDTFALSLVLCYLRLKTGSIWAGMGLHALKNLIAFVLLYILKVA